MPGEREVTDIHMQTFLTWGPSGLLDLREMVGVSAQMEGAGV
jgi:hypothetical protein